ncbi:hypothetical protein TNCV_790151 [Trichonephila clavipes]|nr:hypothetical protein TNCV_790151 [Trichonephila clavipes]
MSNYHKIFCGGEKVAEEKAREILREAECEHVWKVRQASPANTNVLGGAAVEIYVRKELERRLKLIFNRFQDKMIRIGVDTEKDFFSIARRIGLLESRFISLQRIFFHSPMIMSFSHCNRYLSYWRIMFDLNVAARPWNSSCQVIYSQFGLAIHQNDHQARRRFVEWAQNEIAVAPDFHKRILFSDETHFWFNGYVNKQNCRIWSEANPQVYVETPLHPEKLTVWCALWAGGILLQKR